MRCFAIEFFQPRLCGERMPCSLCEGVKIRLTEPMWLLKNNTDDFHEPVNQDASNWDELVKRTAHNFDESRSFGGFLKTYRPVDLDHVTPQERQERRAQLSHLARLSRGTWQAT